MKILAMSLMSLSAKMAAAVQCGTTQSLDTRNSKKYK